MSDKTEEPTPRRLRKAREEGDSGASAFAAQAGTFVVAIALVPATVRAVAAYAQEHLRSALMRAETPSTWLTVQRRWNPFDLALEGLTLLLPLLGCVAAAAALAHVVQTRGVVSTKPLALQFSKLNPVTGFASLFSASRAFSLVRSLAAASIVAFLAYQGLKGHLLDLARLSTQPRAIPTVVERIAETLGWRVAVLGLVLGGLDILITRRSWLRRLRMTKDEIKREHRDAEGDPQLKAARERAHHELLAQATIASVRKASVVVVNPTHLACALRYDEETDAAPHVLAQGEGAAAREIVRAARAHLVPIVEDKPVARALAELHVGDAIPEVLYEAVAAILREVWSAREP